MENSTTGGAIQLDGGGCCKDVNPNWETSNEFMAKYVSFLQNHPGLKFFFLVGCLDCPFLLYFWEDQRIRIRSPKTVPCALKFDSKNHPKSRCFGVPGPPDCWTLLALHSGSIAVSPQLPNVMFI